jgi:hypothetical protein
VVRDDSCHDALGPTILWRSHADVQKERVVSQRTLIYIVGAIVLIIIIVYFLWPFPAA